MDYVTILCPILLLFDSISRIAKEEQVTADIQNFCYILFLLVFFVFRDRKRIVSKFIIVSVNI